ncbi:MAG: hypothetical protein PHW96_00605 [Candidatus Nanoarchaeia archaeon]|nr:hypothetical protein [Candidatus Nanoarchaeia archaeon]
MKYEKVDLEEVKTKDILLAVTFTKKQVYMVSEKAWEVIQTIQKKERFPFFAGIYIGDMIKDKYYPSISAGDYLKLKKVKVKDDALMKFTYGRDIQNRDIIQKEGELREMVRVVNKDNEFVGLGYIREFGIKRVADIGEYLRLEKRKNQN